MRAFVTGATGFIGGHLARMLRERGDEVVALVRNPDKAGPLRDLGCELVEGDLDSTDALKRGLDGADAAFHVAAVYKIGIRRSEREPLMDANVGGTERVLDAAIAAGVPRIVYVSTGNVFGNTHGERVDESYERDLSEGFLSVYDESKYRAHQVAKERIAAGAPIVIVQPGGVYGPDDHSELGNLIEQAATGKLLFVPFPDSGISCVHVEDVARGILLAHDKGRVGESYILAGTVATYREIIGKAAAAAGRKPPKLPMPAGLMKTAIPFGPIVGPLMGFPPNLRELIRASAGVTYWMTDAKARSELGFQPRDLDEGMRETVASIKR
jgi:dihydroflavonol-4-reductase